MKNAKKKNINKYRKVMFSDISSYIHTPDQPRKGRLVLERGLRRGPMTPRIQWADLSFFVSMETTLVVLLLSRP